MTLAYSIWQQYSKHESNLYLIQIGWTFLFCFYFVKYIKKSVLCIKQIFVYYIHVDVFIQDLLGHTR